jgi:phage-related protein
MTLPALYPAILGGETGAFTVTNAGDYPAPVKITIVGTVEDPNVRNVLNGRYYRLTGVTTTNLVIDGTAAPFTVEDGGLDVSGYRAAGSVTPMLSPGANTLAVTGTFTGTPVVTVQWNDTFIS